MKVQNRPRTQQGFFIAGTGLALYLLFGASVAILSQQYGESGEPPVMPQTNIQQEPIAEQASAAVFDCDSKGLGCIDP